MYIVLSRCISGRLKSCYLSFSQGENINSRCMHLQALFTCNIDIATRTPSAYAKCAANIHTNIWMFHCDHLQCFPHSQHVLFFVRWAVVKPGNNSERRRRNGDKKSSISWESTTCWWRIHYTNEVKMSIASRRSDFLCNKWNALFEFICNFFYVSTDKFV